MRHILLLSDGANAAAVAAGNRWTDDLSLLLSHAIYVAGATLGTLVGANRGKYDAFLRRLNPLSGESVWTDQ